jgi:hypothetical protein
MRSSGREILVVPYFPGTAVPKLRPGTGMVWIWDLICGTAGSFSHKHLTIFIYTLGLTLESVKNLNFYLVIIIFSLRIFPPVIINQAKIPLK